MVPFSVQVAGVKTVPWSQVWPVAGMVWTSVTASHREQWMDLLPSWVQVGA